MMRTKEGHMTLTVGSSDLSPQSSRSRIDALGAPVFVWGLWAVMVLAALSFVVKYGRNLPVCDELPFVPYVTGAEPVTFELLWAQNNEHRIPLPMVILLLLGRLTHCDYRAGMFLNVIALGALAFAMIRVAGRLRGSIRYSDGLLPLALLQLGQGENLLWSFQVAFVMSTILASVFLLVIVRHPTELGIRSSVLAGTCLVLLPLCSAAGLVLVPALALWLGSAALFHLASGMSHARRASVSMLTFSIISSLMIVLYFRGYIRPAHYPPCPSLWAGLRTTAQFMAACFGPATVWFWPHAGWAMLGLMSITGGLLVVAWWTRQEERFRVLGLLAFLGAMASLSLSVGWGRSASIFGPIYGFQSRYVTLAVPMLCCVYFTWELYGGRTIRYWGRTILFAIMCALLIPSTISAIDQAKARRRIADAVERDLRQ